MKTDTTQRKVPAPGSPEAVAHGCLCPVLDNAHGRGAYDDALGANGDVLYWHNNVLYWYNSACPLHGVEAQKWR